MYAKAEELERGVTVRQAELAEDACRGAGAGRHRDERDGQAVVSIVKLVRVVDAIVSFLRSTAPPFNVLVELLLVAAKMPRKQPGVVALGVRGLQLGPLLW